MKPTAYLSLITALLLGTFIYISCQKSESSPGTSYQPQPVTASISGRIVDENRLPVSGALVKAGSLTVTTNASGTFNLTNVTVDKNAGMVRVEKEGYFTGIKTIVVTPNKDNRVSLQLIRKGKAGTFSGSGGGSITVPASGGAIAFPATSVVTAGTNTAYTGTVTVNAFFINPEASNFQDIMPGTLRGLTTSNQETGLQSFGMMAVELSGAAGEKLQLATGKSATITFPIPAGLRSYAPATIPLWSLDETSGLWKEEGTATRQGNDYTGTVSHFSFWNCDAPFNVVDFTATILTQQQTGMLDAKVVISTNGPDSSISGFGYTNPDGVVSGKLPANRNLTLKVFDKCGSLLHARNIGPFNAATNLGTITVTATTIDVTFTGTAVNCSAAPITNGYVNINLEGVNYRTNISNGAFSVPIKRCSNAPTTASVIAYDITGNQGGNAVTIAVAATTVNTGQLTACGTSLSQFINFTLNGVGYNYSVPPDSLVAYRYDQNQQTSIYSTRLPTSAAGYFQFSFTGAAATGSYPIYDVSLRENGGIYNRSGNFNVNITEYGAVGGFIAGSFTGNVKDTATASTRSITCTFRVKR
jgi:hypothetical protein